MAHGLKLFAEIVPDTGDLKRKLKGEKIEIEATVKGGKGIGIGGGGIGGAGGGDGGGGGGGGMMQTGMGMAMGMGIMGVVQKIVGFLAGLEPIQAIMEIIGSIMKLFFLPLALMLFTLLRPILIPLLKLMPMWMKFWQDPVGNLVPLIKKIGSFLFGESGIVRKGLGDFIDWVSEPFEMKKPGDEEYGKLPTKSYFFGDIEWLDDPLGSLKHWLTETLPEWVNKWIPSWIRNPLFMLLGFLFGGLPGMVLGWIVSNIKNPIGKLLHWLTVTAPSWCTNWINKYVKNPIGKLLHWFTVDAPAWIEDWIPTKENLPKIKDKIVETLEDVGGIFLDVTAGFVKGIYDIVNALIPDWVYHLDYPDWVKKRLKLDEYADKELPFAGEENITGPGGYLEQTPKFWYTPESEPEQPSGEWNPYGTPYFTPVDDFVLSRGKMYKTNPNDTITGSRNGGRGMPPVINLYVNGVMSEQLMRDTIFTLRRTMERGVHG